VLKGTGTNLFPRSSDLSNAAWGPSNLTVTGGQTDPFGGSTAALLNDGTAASTSHSISQFITSSGPRTFSVYAKAGTANFVALYDSSVAQGVFFNISTGAFSANLISAPTSYLITNVGSGWYRISITTTGTSGATFGLFMSQDGTNFVYTGSNKTIFLAAPQLELGSTANTYIPTTTTAVYGTPTLSFSGVSTIGLESNGSLFVQPAGTGALQAQATTSSATGGNARGQNAVDFQTFTRSSAAQVASGLVSSILGGARNTSNAVASVVVCGTDNTAGANSSFVGAGTTNTANGTSNAIVSGLNNSSSGTFAFIGAGQANTNAGFLGVIVGGQTNSGTSGSAVTTQSATMNATTAVTLSGSNANIKVGQLITGTSITSASGTTPYTYVAAISGTSLTLSQAASGSSTSTLSFYTPHGVVVGGGNNQATGSYSFIGGGGDAGTAANRNVASGDWSFVGGGTKNTASGTGSFVGGGGTYGSGVSGNAASGTASFIGGGIGNTASNSYSSVVGGEGNFANGTRSVVNGSYGSSRGIAGVIVNSYNGFGSFSAGTCQSASYILQAGTTNATATVATVDGSSASTTNQVILPNNSAYAFKGTVIANVTGAANGAAWSFEGAIMRGANAASTVLMGTPAINRVAATAGATAWVIALTADTTNGGLAVTVTGAASTTIRWVASLNTTETTF
jgi:hypothetical protein